MQKYRSFEERKREVYLTIKASNRFCSRRFIQDMTQVGWETLKRILVMLENEGKIHKIKSSTILYGILVSPNSNNKNITKTPTTSSVFHR
jgi:hypothetical protein